MDEQYARGAPTKLEERKPIGIMKEKN